MCTPPSTHVHDGGAGPGCPPLSTFIHRLVPWNSADSRLCATSMWTTLWRTGDSGHRTLENSPEGCGTRQVAGFGHPPPVHSPHRAGSPPHPQPDPHEHAVYGGSPQLPHLLLPLLIPPETSRQATSTPGPEIDANHKNPHGPQAVLMDLTPSQRTAYAEGWPSGRSSTHVIPSGGP